MLNIKKVIMVYKGLNGGEESMTGKKKAIHVTPDQKQWKVKKEGATKASKVCKTKAEAEQVARDQGRKEKTEVVIHNKNGRMDKKIVMGMIYVPQRIKINFMKQ